jgi:hypothetical protein
MKLNPNNTWRLVQQRMEAETDPVVRRNLELVCQHMQAEARGDIEGVVATLCDKPVYKVHNRPDDVAMNPAGDKDAVRAFYDLTIIQTGAHQLELDCDRVVADRESVMTEGTMRIAYPGATVAAMGVEVDDVDAYYLYEARMNIVWPVDPESAMLVGEETWTATDGMEGIANRKLGPNDIAPLNI